MDRIVLGEGYPAFRSMRRHPERLTHVGLYFNQTKRSVDQWHRELVRWQSVRRDVQYRLVLEEV